VFADRRKDLTFCVNRSY